MTLLFSNNAEAVLTNEIYPGEEVFLVVSDGSENMFRSPQLATPPGAQLATLTNPAYPGEYEVIRITSRTGNEFTVDRGVERINAGSDHPEIDNPENMAGQGGARYWPAGTKMSARVTAGTLQRTLSGEGPIVRGGSVVMKVTEDGYSSQAESSLPYSLVFEGRSRLATSVQISAYPVLQLENSVVGASYLPSVQDYNLSSSSVGGTFPVDLGVPATWAGETNYGRGTVVVPTTPGGKQYWAEIDAIGDSTLLTGATEPNWTTTDPVTGGVEDGDYGRWRATDMPIDFEQALGFGLVVTEVGFIAHKVTATTLPSVSIGTAADPDRFASAVQLTQITGNGCVHRIPVTGGGTLANELRYKVDTAATGGQFLGRFYWRGFFVELME